MWGYAGVCALNITIKVHLESKCCEFGGRPPSPASICRLVSSLYKCAQFSRLFYFLAATAAEKNRIKNENVT